MRVCAAGRVAASTKGKVRAPGGSQQKHDMGWKLAFALMLASVAVVAAMAGRGEPEDALAVEEEAAQQLNALREYLFRR